MSSNKLNHGSHFDMAGELGDDVRNIKDYIKNLSERVDSLEKRSILQRQIIDDQNELIDQLEAKGLTEDTKADRQKSLQALEDD
jgi:ribosomal protein S20